MATRTAIINVMAKACYKASRNLLRDFGEVEQLQTSRNGPDNFVITASNASEGKLVEELSFARPEYGILTKGGKSIKSNDPKQRRWIIDPLNGSRNFLHGIPHWAISIGLQEESELVAGVIYDATRDELFWAEKGLGAYLNDTRLRVSERRALADCLISIGEQTPQAKKVVQEHFITEINNVVSGIRYLGADALDLAYVAAGRLDGFWKSDLSPWEMAAGIILIKEAGGYATDSKGGTKMMAEGAALCANARIHHRIFQLLKVQKISC
ncbi:MAG: inositol monophosphatase [Rhodospirillaceae bacterium]|nr:inositol monophosphatase [Rhodospirillaceae bacterium]|tara:strand:- start:43 stop:846 length:804 start_codon:yes stop_codon:yes gene_type:complete